MADEPTGLNREPVLDLRTRGPFVRRIEALEAEVKQLRTANLAAMAIVEAVAEVIWSSYCPWCHRHGTMHEVEHDDDCPVLAARAITGITPTEEDNK